MTLNIRTIIKNLFLNKNIKLERDKRVCNLQHAKTLGFFLQNPIEQQTIALNHLKKELEKQQKKVTILYFYNGKNIPNYLSGSSNLISKKDLTFWGIPKTESIQSFCNQSFDLFVDFSMISNFYSKYIAAISHSHFKVGLHTNENLPFFDLLVKSATDELFEEHLQHILHYLTIINTVKHEA